MPDDLSDRFFASRAMQLGFLTESQLADARRERDAQAPQTGLAEWLVRSGRLPAERRAEVESALARETAAATLAPDGPATDSLPAAAHAPTVPSADASPLPPTAGRLGKYEIIEELGRGGMGIVYRALDVELRREVALKTLLLGEKVRPEAAERLMREARTAATLDHPGIVQIHDFGIAEGVPFFAMAMLTGRTLEEIFREQDLPELRERARLLCDVAHAVAYAHARGVIHRDLKPANILVDPEGKPHVMDFGLAKHLEEGVKLTAEGQMLGTPQYMPPEQIDGELDRIGPASDVYALGAVLYEALTGMPPFGGRSVVEIVSLALRSDPTPPRKRNPRVHADAETICLKALDKDPARRYPTARELAEDLERYLAGEPITARPGGWTTFVGRRVVRNKTAVVLAGAAIVAFGIALLAWHGREALRGRLLVELRRKAGLYLENVLTLRRAGLPMEKAATELLPKMEAAVAEMDRADPTCAEPHLHLGVLYQALFRVDDALREQDLALARDAAFAPARYERALLLARRHATRMSALREQAVRKAAEERAASQSRIAAGSYIAPNAIPPDAELERADAEARALRARLLADLEGLERAAGDASGELSPARMRCARGFALAFGSSDAEEQRRAQGLLAEAAKLDPALVEAYEGWAISLDRMGDWSRAAEVYGFGLKQDKGFFPFRLGRAFEYVKGGNQAGLSFAAREELFGKADADVGAALALDSRSLAALALRTQGLADWARARNLTGRDPSEAYRRAADACLAWDGAAPDSANPWMMRGALLSELALHRQYHGGDPGPLFREAVEACEKGRDRSPKTAGVWIDLAAVRLRAASWTADCGGDAGSLFEQTLRECDRAVELDPANPRAWQKRADARLNQARSPVGRSDETDARLRTAIADAAKANELAAHSWSTLQTNAEAWGALANWRSRRGEDPVEENAKAAAAFTRAVESNPREPSIWAALGQVYMDDAAFRTDHGGNPEETYIRAKACFDKALELNPTFTAVRSIRGVLLSNWGRLEMLQGRDPLPRWQEAESELGEAIRMNPGDASVWGFRSEVRTKVAVAAAGRGLDAGQLYAAADSDAGKAVELAPGDAANWLRRSGTRLESARILLARAQDAMPLLTGARADLDQAVAKEPSSAVAWFRRGVIGSLIAEQRASRGEDPLPISVEAVRDFDRSLEIQPRMLDSLVERAALRQSMSTAHMAAGRDPTEDFRLGEEDAAQALALAPNDLRTHLVRGAIRSNWSNWELDHGRDPTRLMESANADFSEVLRTNPNLPLPLLQRGTTLSNEAFYQVLVGEDPEALYTLAIRDLDACLKIQPAYLHARMIRANAFGDWGRARSLAGLDPEPQFRSGMAEFDRALVSGPGVPGFWSRRGELLSKWGVHQEDAGRDPEALWREALANYDQALKLSPELQEAWMWRGWIRTRLARRMDARIPERDTLLRGAEEDLARARALDKGSAEVYWRLGSLACVEERWREAREAFEESKRLNPLFARFYAAELEEARLKGK